MDKDSRVTMTGNEAVAYAVKQSNVDFIASYPITPQTTIVEYLSDYYANGEIKAKYINVESEHSAMSAVVGGSLAGGRTFTATSSQGLALMHEVLYLAAGLRCPVVLAVATRALSAPINIHGDHSDVMGSRDSGCIQMFSENVQQAYDQIIIAFKLAELEETLLPVMVNLDGFLVTHTMETLKVLDSDAVNNFIPPRKASYQIDPAKPITFGVLALPEYYSEFKRQQEQGMINASTCSDKVFDEYEKISGRTYRKVTSYLMDDAEIAFVSMGTASGTARVAASMLREEECKAGALSIKLFRPFPFEDVSKALSSVETVIVMDRALSSGAFGGPLFSDVTGTLYEKEIRPTLVNFVYGLGGRDVTTSMFMGAAKKALQFRQDGRKIVGTQFLGVRE